MFSKELGWLDKQSKKNDTSAKEWFKGAKEIRKGV